MTCFGFRPLTSVFLLAPIFLLLLAPIRPICSTEQEAQTDSIKMKTRWTQEPAVGLLSAARDDGGYDSDDDEKDIGEQIKQANAQLSKFLVSDYTSIRKALLASTLLRSLQFTTSVLTSNGWWGADLAGPGGTCVWCFA